MTHAVKSQKACFDDIEGKIPTADERILLAIKPKCMKNLHMWRKGVKVTFPTPPNESENEPTSIYTGAINNL